MTKEQKKAIDACKDQAAQKFLNPDSQRFTDTKYLHDFKDAVQICSERKLIEIMEYAMQLYGEQCRKEASKLMKKMQGAMWEGASGYFGSDLNMEVEEFIDSTKQN